ncbi:helicase associated domain-containing protein [Pontibacter sp. 13R65]|uniref:helicase associated domain-containing protein n=1 Tax=Pontibacter sp. 13R65 TaxID=3127458 RepID=UPI00301E080A
MAKLAKELFDSRFLEKWYRHYQQVVTGGALAAAQDENLAQWLRIQARIRHMLPKELQEKLATLPPDLEEVQHSWEARFRQLANFAQQHGHTYLPADAAYEELKDWLIRQVIAKTYLSASQLQRLDQLGVDWEMTISRDHRWEQMWHRLQDFKELFGHCRVPQKWPHDKQLALWVTIQRRLHANNKLREDRARKLSQLNFTWNGHDVYQEQWEGFFGQLLAFRQAQGHCRVPCRHRKLVSWIERQRLLKKKGQLPDEREERLNKIDFIWEASSARKKNWEDKYRQLRAYRQRHGHSFVPVNCRENRELGCWVATQRALEAKGKLEARKRQKLDQLGFVWAGQTQRTLQERHEAIWEQNFEKLRAYYQQHGTCQVSLQDDAQLQRWTVWQRKQFYKGKLAASRIDRLNELRFPWSVQEGYWLRMYEALADFKKQFGHTRVPYQWEGDPQLAAWVYRIKLQQGELSMQKKELLGQLGFDWKVSRRQVVEWEGMYRRLVAFAKEHGHTRVPVKWPEDPKLGKWVSRMRQERTKLDEERVALLNRIGFSWSRHSGAEKVSV